MYREFKLRLENRRAVMFSYLRENRDLYIILHICARYEQLSQFVQVF